MILPDRPFEKPSGAPLARSNARVKEAAKLSRRSVRAARRLFLADGPNAVEAALCAPGCVVEVFATQAAWTTYAALRQVGGETGAGSGSAVPWTVVEEGALTGAGGLSDSVNPAGLVAVCGFLDVPVEDVLATVPRLVAICADVRDPGNAGTIIRTADAAGASAVILAGSSVDAYNPKTIRSTAGSLFHLPVSVVPDVEYAIAAARGAGLTVLAADGAGEVSLITADALLAGPTAWLFGNEAHGLSIEQAGLADHRVSIPIYGQAESLNLSTAAAVCLYSSARAQR